MDEAQALADRVAIIAGGRIVAHDTPASLGGRDHAGCEIRFRLPEHLERSDLPRLDGAHTAVEGADVCVRTATAQATLWALLGWSRDRSVELGALEVTHPSLEDVYLELVGQS